MSALPLTADRGIAGRFPVAIAARVITGADYAAMGAEASDLVARALEPNVFALPSVVGALPGRAVHVAIATAAMSEGRDRLVGVLPVVVEGVSARTPFPHVSARLHEFTVLSTPLLDRAAGPLAMAALFDALSREPGLPRRLALPFLGAGGAAEPAVRAAASATGRPLHTFERYVRARMERKDGGAEAFLAARFQGPKRRKYRSERRRFDGLGDLAYRRYTGAAVPSAFEAFLALEAASWKGRNGTAIANVAADLAFMRRAVADLAAAGGAEVHAIELGGRPAASGLILRSGGGAWFHKIAFDEALAPYSPGFHLSIDVSCTLQDDPGFRHGDSCALRGGGLLQGSWTDEQQVCDVLVDLVPGGSATFGAAIAAATALRRARAGAKALYHRLRGVR